MILDHFGWSIGDRFTPDQRLLIQTAGSDLEVFVNTITGGRGREWIFSHTRGTRIHRGGLPSTLASKVTGLPTSLVFPVRDIWLAKDFDTFPSPKRHFLHELGHVVDNRLPRSDWLPHAIFGGGPADQLVRYLGGKPAGRRYANGCSGIPSQYRWRGAGEYGNHSTADYFAEAFSWLAYDANALPDPRIFAWFKREIFRKG